MRVFLSLEIPLSDEGFQVPLSKSSLSEIDADVSLADVCTPASEPSPVPPVLEDGAPRGRFL